jgi:hypothetical protein
MNTNRCSQLGAKPMPPTVTSVVVRAASFAALLGVAAVPVAAPVAAAPTPAHSPERCIVEITRFDFRPDVVPPGGGTTLHFSAQNCTDRRREVTLTQYGQEPRPCPVLDPVSRPLSFGPDQTRSSVTPETAARCQGTETMTMQITDRHGRLLAKATAALRIVLPGPSPS